jgi:aspartate beta-hydroxylase
MALLKLLPGNLYFREAIFSILGPGAKILPHRDFSNVYLTYQLGLSIPPQCAICVGGEERTWKEGKSLIFDTSYEHEAWNDSNSPRLILLVDFFHPDLNEAEQEFLKNVLASA